MTLAVWTQQQVLDQLISGYRWSSDTITYAFPTEATAIYGSQERAGFVALNASQQAAARLALQTWDDLIAPDFQQTTATTSNIEFGTSTTGVSYAHAYFPTTGSVWFNRAYSDLMAPQTGKHSFMTYVHEIGHALGLDHMGNYNGSGTWTPSSYQDSGVYSLMSYFGPNWGGGASNGQGLVAWADWVGADGRTYSPQTPMLNDIMAIQAIYGAETTTRTGNTVYGFNSNVTGDVKGIYDFSLNLFPILTIYDAAGTDTLDLSGWTTASIINLEPGSYSSCNSMTYNVAIAYNCNIENAIGGAGNDVITGNGLSNVLDGGSGHDTLNGGGGNDYFLAGLGNDLFFGGDGYDTVIFSGTWASYTFNIDVNGALVFSSSTSGQDTLQSVEVVQFSDVTRTVAELAGTGASLSRISVSTASSAIQEGNSGTKALTFVVALDQANSTATSVTWTVGGNINATDIASPTTGTLSFLAGETQKTVQVLVVGDTQVEADEALTLSLSNPSANAQLGTASASVMILNDDVAPVVVDDYPLATSTQGLLTVNGASLNGSIETVSDGDLFKVNLVAGTTYEFNLNRISGNLDTYLELYGTNLQWLAANDNANVTTQDSRIVFTASATGTYYLAAWDSALEQTGNYKISAGTLSQGATLYGTSSANTLNGGSGDDYLYGLAGNDTLNGNAGNDYLDGGLGNDRMAGGLGDDVYIVDSTRDAVTESSASGGMDVVMASVTRTLGKYFENLVLTGDTSINGTGNELVNTLTGNGADNRLNGMAGNDTLIGGDGKDVLIGGVGSDTLTGGVAADIFRFDSTLNASTNVDTVTDFEMGIDKIQLENSVFRKLTKTGDLNPINFTADSSGKAIDSNDYIVYNTTTGDLYYDVDGSGSAVAVVFARLTGIPSLSVSDFSIT